jgi:hypothetical protein
VNGNLHFWETTRITRDVHVSQEQRQRDEMSHSEFQQFFQRQLALERGEREKARREADQLSTTLSLYVMQNRKFLRHLQKRIEEERFLNVDYSIREELARPLLTPLGSPNIHEFTSVPARLETEIGVDGVERKKRMRETAPTEEESQKRIRKAASEEIRKLMESRQARVFSPNSLQSTEKVLRKRSIITDSTSCDESDDSEEEDDETASVHEPTLTAMR